MTQLSPTALEEAAKAMHGAEPWSSFWSTDDARLLSTAAITTYLAQREKEGFVEVPKRRGRERGARQTCRNHAVRVSVRTRWVFCIAVPRHGRRSAERG